MICASAGIVTRWAAGNGGLILPDGTELTEADLLERMPEIGVYDLGDEGMPVPVERVSARYATADDLIAFGGDVDGFGNEKLFPRSALWDAIQAAEEAIEEACRRSFCERAYDVQLHPGFNELPEQDVRSLTPGDLIGDRQATSASATSARMVFGARADARIKRATLKLAAFYLRPSARPENARSESTDAGWISFQLATGTDGSWTGIPEVDAVIAQRKSRRVIVA